MRIGKVTMSPVALYSQPIWDISYSYRVFLISWRLVELSFITVRFLLIRAPILLIWTRLAVTRNVTLPGRYKDLQGILAPEREVKLGVAGGRAGTMPFFDAYGSPEDIRKEQEFLKTIVKPPSPMKIMVSGVLRGLITELGSVFIKFSQILSMRPELPTFIREELALVQDKLPGLPEEEVRTILERELMQPVDYIFEWVDYKPIAAASLAVVYHAKLRNDEEVALKVQRPFLQGTVALDTTILVKIVFGIARLLLPRIRKTDLTFFTLSFESALKREINFELEAHVQDSCKQALLASQQTAQCMYVARVHFEYTTTKLLTMEFVHDLVRWDEVFSRLSPEEIWDMASLRIPGFPDDIPAPLVLVGARFPMQIAWQGEVFHGDLHLGNIYFKRPASGDGWRIFLCDFGMFEDVPREGWSSVLFLLWGILAGFPDMAVDALKSQHLQAGGKLRDINWDQIYVAFSNLGRCWVEHTGEEQSGVRVRRSKLHEGGVTRQLLAVLFGQVIASGLRLPYWLWLVMKSYLYEEEAGNTFMGGSYDWHAWIFDQYGIRLEKDATLALFDRTNVFTFEKNLAHLEVPLQRGRDYQNVLLGLSRISREVRAQRQESMQR